MSIDSAAWLLSVSDFPFRLCRCVVALQHLQRLVVGAVAIPLGGSDIAVLVVLSLVIAWRSRPLLRLVVGLLWLLFLPATVTHVIPQ